ncbi:hypothetical protein B0H34DRAFT_384675 [Crassisporium funariophilum]|nr:hypothetical protein B0H34DRAFT_384675 [Crassisporium funariophilum]
MIGTNFVSNPVDSIRRDAKDGAYHCPQCETPFTRRSNLRRHFQIHMRIAHLKCSVCNAMYHTKEELNDHAMKCYPQAWNNSHNPAFQVIGNPQDTADPNQFNSMAGPSRGYTYSPISAQSSASSQGGFPLLDLEHGSRRNGFDQFRSPLPSSEADAPPSSYMSPQGNSYGSNPNVNGFSHRRPSVSSSISSSSTSSSPYAQNLVTPQGIHRDHYLTSKGQLVDGWVENNRRSELSSSERPIYTRQQVKDMLDVVSDCFIGSIETIMNDGQAKTFGTLPVEPHVRLDHPGAHGDIRRMILLEAVPRMFSRLQDNPGDAQAFSNGYHT